MTKSRMLGNYAVQKFIQFLICGLKIECNVLCKLFLQELIKEQRTKGTYVEHFFLAYLFWLQNCILFSFIDIRVCVNFNTFLKLTICPTSMVSTTWWKITFYVWENFNIGCFWRQRFKFPVQLPQTSYNS